MMLLFSMSGQLNPLSPVKVTMTRTFLALLCLLFVAGRAQAWPSVYPTSTTIYDPAAAFNAYTLFAPMSDAAESPVYLINMNGKVVHQWRVPFAPLMARLQPNGNLVVIGRNDKQETGRPGLAPFEIGGAAGWLVELSWEGKLLFRHVDLKMHHDFAKLPNGNYLYLAWETVPKALQQKVRGGIKGSEFKGGVMFNDAIVEVNPQGKVVWQWSANKHLNPDTDIIGPLYKREEWLHLNSVSVRPDGNILVCARHTDAVMEIDKKTGRINLRWGNSAYLDKTSSRIEYRSGFTTLGGPHDATEIPVGYPGAGNILIYDNGLYADASRVAEITRSKAAPGSTRLVWQSSQPGIGRKHFSNFMGGAQRLPNGNTLISDGANGRFMQVTPQNRTVWEYISPFVPSPQYQGAILKGQQYGPGYCTQFKSLPVASGPAVVPDPNSQLRIPNAHELAGAAR